MPTFPSDGIYGSQEGSTQAVLGIHVHLALFGGLPRWALNSQHHSQVVPLRKSKNFRIGIEVCDIGSSVVSDPGCLYSSVARRKHGIVVARLRDVFTCSGYVGRFILLQLCCGGAAS